MKLNKNNRTFLPEKEKIERKWYLIDARNQTLGRLATKIATILRGKDHSNYTPFMDTGDFVVVINAREVKISGNKELQKRYYRHSGYRGGLREITVEEMRQKFPERLIKLAVKRMLPKNRLNYRIINKLKVYADDQHRHQAQKPEQITL